MRRGRWHRLPHHQQEHDERQQNRRLQIHLLAALHGEEEAQEGDEEDEEAGSDEVDDVEERAALHVDGELDVWIHLRAARVHLLVAHGRNAVHLPFLIRRVVVDAEIKPR